VPEKIPFLQGKSFHADASLETSSFMCWQTGVGHDTVRTFEGRGMLLQDRLNNYPREAEVSLVVTVSGNQGINKTNKNDY
jgi:hypothetical protein